MIRCVAPLLAFILFAVAAPAQAVEADQQHYFDLKLAQAIDRNCNSFKQFERVAIETLEKEREASMVMHAEWQSGTLDAATYAARLSSLAAEAEAAAGDIACLGTADRKINALREIIIPRIITDIVIANDGGDLTPELAEARDIYLSMLRPLYQDLPSVIDYARAKAIERLQAANDQGQGLKLLNGMAGDTDFDIAPELVEFAENEVRRQARLTLERIAFEIVVERHGMYLRPRRDSEGGMVGLFWASSKMPRADVWLYGTTFPLVETGEAIPAAITIEHDGTMRVMTYGTLAARIEDGAALFAVPLDPVPDGFQDDADYYRSAQWRQEAAFFEASRIEDDCLGGPCFEFPPALLTALTRIGGDRWTQLILRAAGTTDLPPPGFNPAVTSLRAQALIERARAIAAAN